VTRIARNAVSREDIVVECHGRVDSLRSVSHDMRPRAHWRPRLIGPWSPYVLSAVFNSSQSTEAVARRRLAGARSSVLQHRVLRAPTRRVGRHRLGIARRRCRAADSSQGGKMIVSPAPRLAGVHNGSSHDCAPGRGSQAAPPSCGLHSKHRRTSIAAANEVSCPWPRTPFAATI
jgi:hypothetical protein